ncbi:16S rRNA (uracil(1498)-N(3))-methyltransferase [Spiroplasma endosymbiont of Anurida maritima]|uniref:RsmE family RNA methyltransferase n=1 Tax=Spiroplasma endosymbiont of Anurida maritima TaxID=2967972 RepID=UPI0036D368F8
MHHFFVKDKKGDSFDLSDEQSHQLKNVLRLKHQDKIVAIYDKTFYFCWFNKELNNFIIIEKLQINNEPKIKINLINCLTRNSKFELMIQKATEIGVHKLIPFQSERSIVSISKINDNKIQRWNKIALEAAEQSRRNIIPTIEKPVSNIRDLDQYMSDLNIVLYEAEDNKSLKDNLIKNIKEITIVIGPEGGFSNKEIEYFVSKQYKVCHIGKRILRTETATIFALSNLIYNYDL